MLNNFISRVHRNVRLHQRNRVSRKPHRIRRPPDLPTPNNRPGNPTNARPLTRGIRPSDGLSSYDCASRQVLPITAKDGGEELPNLGPTSRSPMSLQVSQEPRKHAANAPE